MKFRKFLFLSIVPLLLAGCGGEEPAKPCTHVDNNHDSICDLCGYTGLPVTHVDSNKDHICDICKRQYSQCADNNHDHKCDICGAVLSKHESKLNSHECAICGEIISNHTYIPSSEDKKHECEICGAKGDCVDVDCDYICDICGRHLDEIPVHKAPFVGGVVTDGKYTGYEFEKENMHKQTTGIGEVEIFGFNDLHGIVRENIDENQAGLSKFGTFIRSQTAKENTLCFDQGDTWQGTLESNHKYGSIIQQVMGAADVSLRTVGNHDLDWGIEKFKETSELKYGQYQIPTLASNVYDYNWDTRKVGTTQQSDIGKEYATFTMENGLKVGVVGVIGYDQITSISTQFVKNISFTDHNEKIKEISDYLRTDKNCNFVVASVHGDAEQTMGYGLTSISPVSGKRYVDLVLNAHTHQSVCEMENNVIFSQWGRYTECIGSVTLKYDFDKGEVVDSVKTDRTYYNAKYLRTYYKENDPEIDSLVTKYLDSIDNLSKTVLSSNFSGNFGSDEQLPNLMAEAIFEEAKKQDFDIDVSVVNYARASFDNSTMTYSDLYRCFPFDNEVIIMKVRGSQSVKSIRYNFSYHDDSGLSLNNYTDYNIAVLDYLGLHTDSDRVYDKFPNGVEIDKLKGPNGILTYREILSNYLKNNPEKMFNADDYSSYNWQFSL